MPGSDSSASARPTPARLGQLFLVADDVVRAMGRHSGDVDHAAARLRVHALADDVADLDPQAGLLLDLTDGGVCRVLVLDGILLTGNERPRRLAVVRAADQDAERAS